MKKGKKKIVAILVCIVIIIMANGILIVHANEMENDQNQMITRSGAGCHGVDVSSYNGDIDWNRVKQSGISFAILRLTTYAKGSGIGEDGTHLLKDTKFETNYAGATNAGLKVGVYVYSYASNVEEAKREALLTTKYLANRPLGLPVYYDLEENSRARKELAYENTEMTLAFCKHMKSVNYWPGVYSSAVFLNSYMNVERLINMDRWAARYLLNEHIPFGGDMSKVNELLGYGFNYGGKYTKTYPMMWQYTSQGTVEGINGYVDLNYRY